MAEVAPFAAWMAAFRERIQAHHEELTDLDRQIGDADHGSNMLRGVDAVAELDASSFDDAGAYLKKAGMTLVSKVGGASGPLYGTFLMRMGKELDGKEMSRENLVAGLAAGLAGLQARGKAVKGDKTMVDVWLPAVEAAQGATGGVGEALQAALAAGAQAAEDTIPMVAHKGRASYLGERSAGVKDPGSASSVYLLEAAAEAFGE